MRTEQEIRNKIIQLEKSLENLAYDEGIYLEEDRRRSPRITTSYARDGIKREIKILCWVLGEI